MSKIYLAIALPKITLDAPLELTRTELNSLLDQNLLQSEQNCIKEIHEIRDIENAILWFQDQEMPLDGTYSQSEYRIALFEEDKSRLPKSVSEFISQYRTQEERKREVHKLLFSHLKKGVAFSSSDEISFQSPLFSQKSGYTTKQKIYQIEYLPRIFLGYMRAVEEKKEQQISSYATEIIEALGLSYNRIEEWPTADFQQLRTIWSELNSNPIQLEKALFEWKFFALEALFSSSDDQPVISPFTLDEILIYCAQYDLVELEQMKKPVDCRQLIEQISQKRCSKKRK
ncbi:MAG: DUF2764 family protein [Chlamydia sp.]